MESVPRRCGAPACGGNGAQRCSRCKCVSYCGRACQANDWLAHRRVCGATADGLRAARHEAVLTMCANNMPAARTALLAILAVQSALIGAHAYETLMTRRDLARCAMQSGDYAGAEPMTREIAARLALVRGPRDAATLGVRGDVVECVMAASRHAEALGDATALAELSAECFGADAEIALYMRRLRCECMFNLGRYADARAGMLALLGDHARLGNTALVQNCKADLVAIAHEAGAPVAFSNVAALPAAAACTDVESCMRRQMVAQYHCDQNDYARALQENLDILAALRRIAGIEEGHQDVLRMRGAVADCLDDLGRPDAACAEYSAAIAVAERALGEGHAMTLHLRKQLAVVKFQTHGDGAAETATAELRAVLATQRRVDAPQHEQLSTQMQLAIVTTDARAKTALLRDLVPRLVSACGAENRNTLAAQRMLSKVAPRCDAPACAESAAFACSGCTHTIYCSEACQHADWAAHKPACAALACGVCGAAGTPLLACNRCGHGRYCSKRCRHADWPAHKGVCSA